MWATNNNRITPEYLLERLKEIKRMPAIASKLLMLLAQNSVSIEEIGQVISKDPALLSRILTIANSPVYKRDSEIYTAKDAIMVLGTKAIMYYSMFLAVKSISRPTSDFTIRLWDHSLAVSAIAKLLAKETGVSPDIAASAGLLHDIGSIIIDSIAPKSYAYVLDIYQKYTSGKEVIFAELEREIIGIDHCEIGSYAARIWNFPSLFVNIIEKHHNCLPGNMEAYEIESNPSFSIVKIADCIAMSGIYKECECWHKDRCNIFGKYKKHLDKIHKKFTLAYEQDRQLLFA